MHLHELGALDTIVDVTGVLLGLELLGVERVICSPVPLGRGTLTGSHGRMPLPAPATVALLTGAPVVGVDHALETVTPTAAALITELASAYGPIPAMRLQGVGYGAGTRTTPEPNVLRVLLGEAAASTGLTGETLDLLETNIDDMNPEIYGYLVERLLAAGALDAYLTPVIMKKNRPAVEVSVLCRPEDTARLRDLLFAETTTLGIRTQQVARHCLSRTSEQVTTPFGPVRVKIGRWGPDLQKAAPEYEDCRAAAQAHNVPLRTVYEAALVAWHGAAEQSQNPPVRKHTAMRDRSPGSTLLKTPGRRRTPQRALILAVPAAPPGALHRSRGIRSRPQPAPGPEPRYGVSHLGAASGLRPGRHLRGTPWADGIRVDKRR